MTSKSTSGLKSLSDLRVSDIVKFPVLELELKLTIPDLTNEEDEVEELLQLISGVCDEMNSLTPKTKIEVLLKADNKIIAKGF